MALLPNALTTIAAYKTYMEIPEDDTDQDAAIEMEINAVSDWIEGETDRKFAITEYVQHFTSNVRKIVLLDQYPVLTATVRGVSGESTEWTMDKAKGILVANTAWHGIAYTVEYTAGFVLPKDATEETPRTLPTDLEISCIEIVAMRLEKRSSNHLAVEVTGPLRDEFLPNLPYHLQSVIDRYKKKVIG